jgi:hypothetical protein
MKKISKLFLISIFFSYYLVAIALNFPWINEHFKPLEHLYAVSFKKISPQLYLGNYPGEKIRKYQNDLGLERVITLMDPDFPVSRELLKKEEEMCKRYGLELIVIPVSFFSRNPMDYMIIRDIVNENSGVTLIHTYYFDGRMQTLEKILKRYGVSERNGGSVESRSK